MTSTIASLLNEGVANGSVLGVSYIAVDEAGKSSSPKKFFPQFTFDRKDIIFGSTWISNFEEG
jgi:hypothetical protein